MTSSASPSSRHAKQVKGVGFSLTGKVKRRERARIEALVEDYIRRNYDLIRAQFTTQANEEAATGVAGATSAVRLCINRTSNEVTIVSVGSSSGGGHGGGGSGGGGKRCHRRQRRLANAEDGSQDLVGPQDPESTTTALPAGAVVNGSATAQECKAAAAQREDCSGIAGHGESMEAAIVYLMSRDRRNSEGGMRTVNRMLKSSIPKGQSSDVATTANLDNVQAVSSLPYYHHQKHQQLQVQQQQQQQQQEFQLLSSKTVSRQPLTDESPESKILKRLVGDSYDCEARGKAFRSLFPSVRGEFYIFYDHGESHCRNMLSAMGFKERREEEPNARYRSIDDMAVLWCNGAISASKRKNGMGYHIVNRLRFRGLVTNKCSLVRTMREFELNHPLLVPKGLEAASFLPATMHLNEAGALDVLHKIRHGGMYLLKPGFSDCGKGIVLYRSDGGLSGLIDTLTGSYPNYTQKDLVLQKYIENPLLLGGKKFDLRVFLLIIPNLRRETGVYAFVHPGYARLACRNYDINSNDMTLHLTNQAVQYKDKTYKNVKEDTVWSPDTLNQYLNKRRAQLKVPCYDWVKRRLFPRVRAILSHLVSVVSSSLCEEPLSYELFGCDFLVDDRFNVWLLEVNSDPSLNKSTKVLRQIVTQVVEEGVGLAVEVLQRTVRGMPIKALTTEQDFKKVFSHTNESVQRCALAESHIRYPQHFVR